MSGLTIGSLFSGIGGLELGLERGIGEGCRTVWQVEQDEYCRAVLAKHWPNAKRYEDVRNVGRETLERVDIICGGFPCQDVSDAGVRRGIAGERSGLWSEFARIISEIRPQYAVVENVTGLLARGMGRVLGDLAAIRYDAEWDCVPAAAIGAPHIRDRVFVLAYRSPSALDGARGKWRILADASDVRLYRASDDAYRQTKRDRITDPERSSEDVADTESIGRSQGRPEPAGLERRTDIALSRGAIPDAKEQRDHDGRRLGWPTDGATERGVDQWSVEPDVGRVANGVPSRVDRLRALGNAVVPQVAEVVGRLIAEREKELRQSA